MAKYANAYRRRSMKRMQQLRMEMINYWLSMDKNIRATARHFGVSRITVRMWTRRYTEDPHALLIDRRVSAIIHPDTDTSNKNTRSKRKTRRVSSRRKKGQTKK